MKKNPVIAKSHKLQAESRWPEAIGVIRAGLDKKPTDPNLNAEMAWLLTLSAKEDDAMTHLQSGASGERGADVVRALAHHFHCRCLAAKKLRRVDSVAEKSLRVVEATAKRMGIALESRPGLKLTACMIVKNEEANLRECLNSISGIVDEVVIVDTGSTDKTLEIAKNFRAKTGRFEWSDDFSAARNHALTLATGDWILWIDADERLAANSAGAIVSALVRPHFGGFTLPIINYLNDDEEQDQVQHRPCRLFRRLGGVEFEGRIHEQIAPSISRLGLPIARLEGATIKHYGYRSGEMLSKGKYERTVTMLRRELEQNPGDGFQLFNLGNALFTAGEYEEAASTCKEACLKLEPGVYHAQFCYQLWAFSLFHLNRNEEALAACGDADKAGCGGQLIEYARAFALRSLDRHEEALVHAQKACDLPLGEEETGDRSVGAYKAEFLKGQILSTLEQREAALACYQSVLKTVPGFTPARLSLALELRRVGQLGRAFEEAESVVEDSDNGRIAADLATLCALDMNLPQDAIRVREKAWRVAPHRSDMCLAWAHCAEDVADWWTAAKAYNAFLCKFQPTAAVMINAGRALAALDKNQAALDCFSKAIDLDPEDANAYLNTGDLLYKCEKYTDAALAYRAGLARETDNSEGWFTLGNALYYSGSPDGAALAYEQALRLDPSHTRAAENLGLVFDDIKKLAS